MNIITSKVASWDKVLSIFFNRTEYKPHEKTAASIHKSPIVKSKLTKLFKLALEIIRRTPIIDNIIPKNCIKYVWVLKINHEKSIINSGVIEAIIEELITIDVCRDK